MLPSLFRRPVPAEVCKVLLPQRPSCSRTLALGSRVAYKSRQDQSLRLGFRSKKMMISSTSSTTKSIRLPPGAWDSHVHVVDEDAFPFAPDHAYRPRKASVEDLLRFEEGLGVEHVCLVAISSYGTDNRLLLQSLRDLGGGGNGKKGERAVIAIDPGIISDEELEEMHALGVRGVRVNLKSTRQEKSKEELEETLRLYAGRVRRFKWAIQLHIGLADVEKIANEVPKLGVQVVIDHLATPDQSLAPRLQPGYLEFMELLSKKQIWVKLSGIYRFPDLPELDAYVREILRVAPTQVVWASDWPHTGGVKANPKGDRHILQDYRKVDVPAFIARCKMWCEEDEALIEKVFVDNPRRLWQYEEV